MNLQHVHVFYRTEQRGNKKLFDHGEKTIQSNVNDFVLQIEIKGKPSPTQPLDATMLVLLFETLYW